MSASNILATSMSDNLAGLFDPVEIAHDENTPMLILESADIITKLSEKSMVLLDLALKIEARDNRIDISVMIPEAQGLLDIFAEAFEGFIIERKSQSLSIFMPPLYDQLDMLAKMKSRSALDILRVALKSIIPHDSKYQESLMITGVFAYDFLDHFEKLPTAKQDLLYLPDFLFYVPLTVIILDHKHERTTVCVHALGEAQEFLAKRLFKARTKVEKALLSYKKPVNIKAMSALDPATYQVDVDEASFGELVERCKEYIRAGDVYQIVPSRTFSRPIQDILGSYRALRSLNPSPYMFYVRTEDWTLFGASPETFIKVDNGGTRVSIRPIAGTRRRGLDSQGLVDQELDAREQASLCLDEKELAEHMMLVDLARNDIASIAQPSSRRISRLLGVDRFSHVMHLVSEVEGILRENCDALSAFQASMNMGTLMGAPKVRAAELLRILENSKRGFYGGAVGYINQCGDMDTAIIIRSAVVKNKHAYVRAGCGVVYDSERAFEVRETINKAEAVLKAIDIASRASRASVAT
jgi:anthranilate synthase component 1